MKNQKEVNFVKVLHRVTMNSGEEYYPKFIPEKLANDADLMRVMDMVKADEMEGTEEQIAKEKEQYRAFLKSTTDYRFLEGLMADERLAYKKDALRERVFELKQAEEAASKKVVEPVAEVKPQPKPEPKAEKKQEPKTQE